MWVPHLPVHCHVSEGSGSQFQFFHSRHRGIAGELLAQAWFLTMNGLLWFSAHSLGLGSLDGLLGLVASFEETRRHFRFSAEELVFLKEYDMRAGLEPLTDDHYSQFPPSRIIVLSNYLLLSRLFTEIGTAAQGALTSVCRYTNFDGSSPPLGHPVLEMGIIDSHFHMDRVMFNNGRFTARSGLKDVDVTPPVHLAYAIANYVYPSSWNSLSLHMRDDRLGFTLGLHPHMVTKTNYMFYLHKIELLFQQYPRLWEFEKLGTTWHPGVNTLITMTRKTTKRNSVLLSFNSYAGVYC